jgi:uncharacterized protein (TIGR03437 family)
VINSDSPASPGEIVVLYATGLGPTNPLTPPNKIPTSSARLTIPIQVFLNGIALSKDRILYAGVTPGFAGLFQINVRLPDVAGDPEIRVGTADRMSPAGRYLRLSRNIAPQE